MIQSVSVSPQPAVAESSLKATDTARNRVFPVEVWYPEAAGAVDALPLILFSHHSGGSRRASTFLTTHLASYGYVVAAMDHSEVVVSELLSKENETPEQKAKRGEGWIASRVPDLRFLLDYMLSQPLPEVRVDADRIGAVGHSFGGWTVLEAPGPLWRLLRAAAGSGDRASSRLPPNSAGRAKFRCS